MPEGEVLIYGASDDLIEIEGACPGCDEYNDEHAVFVLTGTGGATRIAARYTDGVWAITVAPVDESVPMLPVEISARSYTALARVQGVAYVVRENA